jgi:hypothetical protein
VQVGYTGGVSAASRLVRVSVQPLPSWLDAARFVGGEPLERIPLASGALRVELELTREAAALLLSRCRGLGIDGVPLEVAVKPGLSRDEVRAGRLADARERRDTTPGFRLAGARATGEGRYSLTPEALALALGRLAQGRTVLETCVGSGGNSVGFARAGSRVTGFELDAGRLAEAQHNGRLYGVSGQLDLRLGDAIEAVPEARADILFVDPPWGGEDYDRVSSERADFPLLDRLLGLNLSGYSELWLKLPSSFRVGSVPGASASAWFGEAAGDRQRIKFVLLRRLLGGAPGG